MVTAYDTPSARIADDAGVDIILVGDSVAMVVLGYDDTLSVTIDDMAHHTAAVARAKPKAMVVADMPWMSYHVSREETVRNAARLLRAGASAVKLEGGRKRLDMIERHPRRRDPGDGPPRADARSPSTCSGGFKVQAKEFDAARALLDDAVALAEAGCFSIVLECVPDAVATMVTEAVPVPTIGIGAGAHCDGQVLVFHDLLGLNGGRTAQVRAPLRRPAGRRHRRRGAVRRRRAVGPVPFRGGDLPLRRRHPGARPLPGGHRMRARHD